MPDLSYARTEPLSHSALGLPVVTTDPLAADWPQLHAPVSGGGASSGKNPSKGPCDGGPCEDAAGGRRARKRGLPDLQQELKDLTARFEQLSRVNGFLRDKLKALERALPHKDQHFSFLASVHGADPQAASLASSSPSGSLPSRPSFACSDSALLKAALIYYNNVPVSTDLLGQSGLMSFPGIAPSGEGGANGPTRGPGAASPPQTVLAVVGEHQQDSHRSHRAPLRHAEQQQQQLLVSYGAAAAAASMQRAAAVAPSQLAERGGGGWPCAVPSWQALHGSQGAQSSLLQLHGCVSMPVPAVLALCPGPDGEVQELSPEALEQLRRVTPAEFVLLWKHMCSQVGLLVASAEALGPASPQHARLERFLGRMVAYMSKVVLLSPTCYLNSLYVNVETGQRERPGDDFWAAIGTSLQFSPEQLQEIESLYMRHEQSVAPVLRERSAMVQQLSSLMATLTRPSPKCVSNDAVEALSAVEDLTVRLQRNAVREYQSHGDTNGFLTWSVLTPLQLGKAFAASYPYIPDGVAIMHGVNTARRRGATGTGALP